MRSFRRSVLTTLLLAGSVTWAGAQTTPQDFRLTTLEQLMSMEVTVPRSGTLALAWRF